MSGPSTPMRHSASLNAWVLSRYDDVVAALRNASLQVPGAAPEPSRVVREAAREAFDAAQLEQWRPMFERRAGEFVDALMVDEPVDLLATFAAPWSLWLAGMVSGLGEDRGDNDVTLHEAARFARVVFDAASRSQDGTVTTRAEQAAVALAALLADRHGNESHAASVQAFVALSHTLPALLTRAWKTMLAHGDAAVADWRQPCRRASAMNDMLRLAGPSRAVFRIAAQETVVAGEPLRAGDRLVLMLSHANRDAANTGHVAFGAGAHACVGASLVRLALEVTTTALFERTTRVALWPGDASAGHTSEGESPSDDDRMAIAPPVPVIVIISRDADRRFTHHFQDRTP